MPIHDWAKVDASVFHDVHHSWIVELSRALNGGLLPSDYYCLIERWSGGCARVADRQSPGTLATPPTTRLIAVAPSQRVELDESRLAIRSPDDETIAIVEIVSRGNKRNLAAIARFSARIRDHLAAGVHLLVADLHPPGRLDPGDMHGAIWADMGKNLDSFADWFAAHPKAK